MTLRKTFEDKLYEAAQLCDNPVSLGYYHKMIERQKLKRQGKENKAS